MSETVLNSAYRLDVVAKYLKVPAEQLVEWNPGIEKRLQERGESVFYLPRNLMMDFEINKNTILNSSLKP